jgi:OOP family OmpA-OmpF porin
MKSLGKALGALVLVPALVSGCSSMGDRMSGDTTMCVIAGAVGGASATLLADGGGAAVVGALAGAVMGDVICGAGFEPDEDGDGVPDSRDKCPGTPKGVKVFSNGCPLDTDADGVPDYLDKCPDTPRGATVNADGCPMDTDGDGVYDGIDKCPQTPAGVKVEADGCPAVGDVLVSIDDINFAFDSAKLRPEAKPVLDNAVSRMQSSPSVTIKLIGHTDSTGPADYNMKLSERRAKAVMDYLVSNGVAASRIMTEGKGEDMPRASNATREGRAMNRRVEGVLVSK